MALEAQFRHDGDKIDYTPTVAWNGGEVRQLNDGRAAYTEIDIAAGVKDSVKVSGVVKLAKTANICFLMGGRVYWDFSANTATYKKDKASQDFYVGVAVEDVAGSESYVHVLLNEMPRQHINLLRDPFDSVVVLTAGTPDLDYLGGYRITMSATAEAQKVDMLSRDSIAVDVPMIAEYVVEMVDDGDAAAIDINFGLANATHATDADSITESIFCHLDGNSTQINLESDDGTTEVASTDSTYDYTLSTPFEVWIDKRSEADPQIYVNGILALTATTFGVSAATGPWKLLVHAEKTSDDTPLDMWVHRAEARIFDQAADPSSY